MDEKYDEVNDGSLLQPASCTDSENKGLMNEWIIAKQCKYCERYRLATYYSRRCQKADWSRHKSKCEEFTAQISESEARKKQSHCFLHIILTMFIDAFTFLIPLLTLGRYVPRRSARLHQRRKLPLRKRRPSKSSIMLHY